MADDKTYAPKLPKGHVQERDLQLLLKNGGASRLELLEHIGACGYCTEELIRAVEKKGLLTPPPSFKEEVLQKSRTLRIQTTRMLHDTSARMQLFFYSLRVGCAVFGALVLLFLSGAVLSLQPEVRQTPASFSEYREQSRELTGRDQERPDLSHRISEGSNRVGRALQDFSNKLIQMEVMDNDE